MSGNLVTIATFDLPAKAQLARNALTQSGIQAVVTDESVVAMDWLLGNAVGWVKVQVLEEDAGRAVAALNQAFGENAEGLGSVDPEQLAAEAEASAPEDDEPDMASGSRAAPLAGADGAEPPPPAPGSREDYARRLFFAAWFGLAFPPVSFYALYLLLNAAFGEGELSPRGRYNLLVGAGVTVLALATSFLFIFVFLRPQP